MSNAAFIELARRNSIVVTGMGAFCGAGSYPAGLWQNVSHGQSPAVWLELPKPASPHRIAAAVAPSIDSGMRGFRTVRKMDRSVQLALAAANQAWDAALPREQSLPGHRVGIIVGTSRGPLHKWAESMQWQAKEKMLPSMASNSTLATISGALSQVFTAHGPCFTVSSACASGAVAIAMAAQQLIAGTADLMLAGGSEATLHPLIISQLYAAGVLGNHEDPKQTCRPFDRERNGLLLGEGAGFLVLETLAHAQKRGAQPLARLAGWAVGADSSGRAGVTENGDGLFQVMQEALQLAGISHTQIDYFNAHGTGTVVNDRAESRALQRMFESTKRSIVCSSTKPVTGHCLGASPALESIISVEALRHQIIPPTANYTQPDPSCPLDVVPGQARPARLNYVMSNSLGFWGNNASLIFAPAD